jgi:hypothetical protein
MAAANSSAIENKGSAKASLGFGNFSKWFVVISSLSLLSLMMTSSYNRLLSTSVMTPTVLHQQSHSSFQLEKQLPRPSLSNQDFNSSIVLLLSFPNSGTSYTLANTQTISDLTVATSYDQEILYSGTPLFVGAYEQSPYILNASLGRPRNILTKTHCTGHCEVCVPEFNLKVFETECLSLTKYNAATKRNMRIPYNAIKPSKAVHLFRNPHDNLVARMHMGVERRRTRLLWTEYQLARFTFDESGFSQWCSYVDSLFKGNLKEMLRNQYGISEYIIHTLPCLSEWFRWVKWHNNAIAMLETHEIPALVLYYEDYTNNYQQAVNGLFNFMDLEQLRPPAPFIAGKTYESYFSLEAKQLAAELVQQLASPKCWSIIQNYFHHAGTQTTISSVALLPQADSGPKVAWLLSYPNSVRILTANVHQHCAAHLADTNFSLGSSLSGHIIHNSQYRANDECHYSDKSWSRSASKHSAEAGYLGGAATA